MVLQGHISLGAAAERLQRDVKVLVQGIREDLSAIFADGLSSKLVSFGCLK